MRMAAKFGSSKGKRPVFKGRSDFESKIAEDLAARGIPFTYESDALFYVKMVCPHCSEVVDKGVYTPDFFIPRASGIRLVIEAKGYLDAGTRKKMLQVKKSNPKEDIRFLFYRDDKLSKASKTRLSGWAKKNGFPCAIGTKVPQEWIDEPRPTVGCPIVSKPAERKRKLKPKEGELF